MAVREQLYDLVEPFDTGFLKVTDIHTLHYEQAGNPNGNPVVYVHGGPGGGIGPADRQYFDPKTYRIVLFSQRGCGQSTPSSCLEENTTWDLVEDLERIRKHLGIDRWVVFGGSWGSTLSLTYAIKHPEQVKALVLRGIFTLRYKELAWFYENANGASFIYPDAWEEYISIIPEEERGNVMQAYHRRLTSDDMAVREEAAAKWSAWEMSTSRLLLDKQAVARADDGKFALEFARIENHYFVNKGFFETDSWIIDNVDVIKKHNIPGVIVQGRYDVVCPAVTAWELHKAWPEAEFHIVPDAGHSAKESGISAKLVAATEKFKDL
ncbi:Alpha/Beta hydrolase protein [Umbelopsis sp. AD052]|nr:Alpha/Beta hydrolase protein [Umbelopsis sp. AD052]